MRILLIGNYPSDRQESMLRFATLLERELAARGHAVTLLQPQARLAGTRETGSGLGKWLGYVDKFVFFPRTLKSMLGRYDVVHLCDHSNAMYTRYLAGVPNVVTCHDVLAIKSALGEVPQNVVSSTGKRLQAWILSGLKMAQHVVCVSDATRGDFLRVTGRAPEAAEVVYSSLNYPYTPMPREQALSLLDAAGFDAREPYFLHCGGGAWYKNRLALLHIFRHLCALADPAGKVPRLLFVGGALEPEMTAFLAESALAGQVHHLSGISNETLRAAYSLSRGLIFPSLQEGFGWPVLEAQACGCPVFATSRAPMTELGGDAAVYFDPGDPAGAAGIIAGALAEDSALRAKGLENVKRFTVDHMIEGYLGAYARVAAQPSTIRERA